MAEKDVGEKTLIAFNDVFADIFNGLVFHGEQVITADSLEEVSPVISIVLYFGEKPWKYPKNLVDCFEPALPENEITNVLKHYIQDYKVHVFDIPRLKPEEAIITHVDEFLKLMRVLTGNNKYEEVAKTLTEKEKEEGVRLMDVLDFREARGEARGIILGEARLSKLISELLAEEKYEEIKKVTSDEEARKEYYTLYNI